MAVATSNVVFTLATFPTTTHFVDCQVQVPTVRSGDAWAGQNIGVQLLSTVGFELYGGYWDIDNVRLTSDVERVLVNPAWTNGHFTCTLRSEPGAQFAMLATTNLTLPLSNWTSVATLTNDTGTYPFVDAAATGPRRFYRAQPLP